MSPRLAFAIEAALLGGRSTLAHFQLPVQIESKADESPVTIADKNAERLIRMAIEKQYPGEAILGEEEGGSKADDRWIIDPIDGTKSFISGVPLYSTLLSYEVAGSPILGVVYFPALNELVYAETGSGTFFNGRQCHVTSRSELPGSTICCGGHKSMLNYNRWQGFEQIVKQALVTRTWSDAYGHALVATGRVDAMVDPVVSRWDLSAVKVIVEEAGGRFSDFKNANPFEKGDLGLEAISSNGAIHSEILKIYQG